MSPFEIAEMAAALLQRGTDALEAGDIETADVAARLAHAAAEVHRAMRTELAN